MLHNVKGACEEYFEDKVRKNNFMCSDVMNHDEYCELPNCKWESNNEVGVYGVESNSWHSKQQIVTKSQTRLVIYY